VYVKIEKAWIRKVWRCQMDNQKPDRQYDIQFIIFDHLNRSDETCLPRTGNNNRLVLPLIEIKTSSATLYLRLSSLATIMLISIYKQIRWLII
jgi:hypothetical protein